MTKTIRHKCPTADCGGTAFYRLDYVCIDEEGDEYDASPGDTVHCRECDEVAEDVHIIVEEVDEDQETGEGDNGG